MIGNYGKDEFPYCRAFANGVAHNSTFKLWFLAQTKFADRAEKSVVMKDELDRFRVKKKHWSYNYHCQIRRCPDCLGKETDILLIFTDGGDRRYSIHIECKHPGDSFKPAKEHMENKQAEQYTVRASVPHLT